MPTIRILDETKDGALLAEAWAWETNAPEWFRQAARIHKETFPDFASTAKDELLVGVFDPHICAVVRFVPSSVWELHLMAKKGIDPAMLTEACRSIKSFVESKGIKQMAGWVPRLNRGVVKLYQTLGFTERGVRCFQGRIKNRVCEWVYYENDKNS